MSEDDYLWHWLVVEITLDESAAERMVHFADHHGIRNTEYEINHVA